jgi:hypothetical protein
MEHEYTCLLGCNDGEYPFRYLGIPMHHSQLLNSEWHKVKDLKRNSLVGKLNTCHIEEN